MSKTTRGIGAFLKPGTSDSPAAVRPRVLLADDDPAIVRLARQILRHAGYEVATVANGQEAMQAIRSNPPDFVITDWNMPVVSGIELCEFVRREPLPHYIYLVVMTGKKDTKDMVRAVAAGADDFVSKPIIPGELLSRIQAGLRIVELERQLRFLAKSDDLTKLLNRRTFFKLFEAEWRRSQAENSPLACVMIDVDLFKAVNDAHGHLAGDEVLKAVSRTIKECCLDSAQACRYGGEEFCVMLSGRTEQAAALWAQRCRAQIAQTPVFVKGKTFHVTASFGVAENTQDAQTAEHLLDRADQALLWAKRAGRNQVVRFSRLPCELARNPGPAPAAPQDAPAAHPS
ncbi:MAG: GGDEF domain-containing response regulator [Thermoguttaceae bacterium]